MTILKATLFVVRGVSLSIGRFMDAQSQHILDWINTITEQQFVFFTHGDDVAALNKVMLYVRQNETTRRIKIVTVVKSDDEVPDKLANEIDVLDHAYPEIDMELVVIHGTFGPELIDELSKKWKIPTNLMFMGSPSDKFVHGLADLRGVRLII